MKTTCTSFSWELHRNTKPFCDYQVQKLGRKLLNKKFKTLPDGAYLHETLFVSTIQSIVQLSTVWADTVSIVQLYNFIRLLITNKSTEINTLEIDEFISRSLHIFMFSEAEFLNPDQSPHAENTK